MSVNKGETVILVGTKKGLFVVHSRDRKRWKVEKPSFEGLPIYHAITDGKSVFAAVTNEHWGPSVQRSGSWGVRWAKVRAAPAYAKASGLSVERVWSIAREENGTLYAGVEPAGLFRSDDDGASWESVDGFNARPDRNTWMPGGGGLCLHAILPYPGEPKWPVVAASSVGIFGTNDAGATWRVMNGLPSPFGFPMVAHPHDAGTVYSVPLVADMNRVTPGGAMAVYRTTNAGRSWSPLRKGLPQKDAFLTVLRDAMATDGKDPAGLYVGTTGGHLFASRDEGDSWETLAETLPPILSVTAGVAR